MNTRFSLYEPAYEGTEGCYPFGREPMCIYEQTCQRFLIH